MLKLHIPLKPRVLVTLLAVVLTAFFSTEIVGFLASVQGVDLGEDVVDLDRLGQWLFPVGVLAFGIMVGQFLPIWSQHKS